MSELSVEAPLAKTEEFDFGDFQCSELDSNSNNVTDSQMSTLNNLNNCSLKAKLNGDMNSTHILDNAFADSNFTETFSGSLEDLVNTFDEKITECFRNYDENVENLAPVQIRSQEEVMSENQIWWTLTGNFGNILPIDWSKTYARQLHLPTLKLNEARNGDQNPRTNINELLDTTSIDEEELAKDLDLHSLILNSIQQEPIFTAEQVLEEIDEIMQDSPSSSKSDVSMEKAPANSRENKIKSGIASLLYEEKMKALSVAQLNELYMELERMIQDHSETLIQELAFRDELEFEKELKNNFISLLLSVQNKRRQHHIERKRGRGTNELVCKYLTTVIPYNTENGPPDVRTLQVLIKILKAVNEDSPTVPTLLTDYILKVLCPT